MESWLTPLGTETSHENDKSKALSPGQVFELEAVYRRRTRAVSPVCEAVITSRGCRRLYSDVGLADVDVVSLIHGRKNRT